MKKILRYAAVLLAVLPALVQARVSLPSILSDHAVLQRTPHCVIWGRADAGEAVSVDIAGVVGSAVADGNGDWRVELALADCPEGPHELKVNDLVIHDVLLGDVWLCSGQSNMQFTMRTELGLAREQAAASTLNGRLRCFCTSMTAALEPQWDVKGSWVPVSDKTLPLFGGVAYYFGKEILQCTDRAIGLVQSSWGGTGVEAWMPAEALAPFPEEVELGRKRLERFRNYPRMVEEYLPKRAAWERKFGREDTPHVLPADAEWQTVTAGTHEGFGISWFRRNVEFSAQEVARPIQLHFSYQRTPFSLFLDGKEIACHSDKDAVWYNPFIITLPADSLTPGSHEFMLRFHVSAQDTIEMLATYRFGSHEYRLAQWEYYRERSYGRPTGAAMAEYPAGPGTQVFDRQLFHALYNGMIHPFTPCTLRGIIWYQGENDASRPDVYARVFPAMITGWRKKFKQGDLPFYFCQLPAYTERLDDPAAAGWGPLREAQDAALKLPRVQRAILIDTGEGQDIHPRDKSVAGHRLALLALNKEYGLPRPCVSPVATKARLDENAVRVSLECPDGGLTLRPVAAEYSWNTSNPQELTRPLKRHSPQADVEDVALQDADGGWHWADDARLEGSELVASCHAVPHPVAIRYCYAPFPAPTIYSQSGLPLAPFQLSLGRPGADFGASFQAPETFPAEEAEVNLEAAANIRPILYAGEDCQGKPTRVFCWYGTPSTGKPPYPAVVLVHGGGGTAFAEWVRRWNVRSFAAIAMDTVGTLPTSLWEGASVTRPSPWNVKLPVIDPRATLREQWPFQAISAVIRANSLLRSFPEIDANRIGIVGISWGGWLTAQAAAIDGRFAFAAVVYGCGHLGDGALTPTVRKLGEFPPELQKQWLSAWDPAAGLASLKCPLLMVTDCDDAAYPLASWLQTCRDAAAPAVFLSNAFGHSHHLGDRPEVLRFAKAACGMEAMPPSFGKAARNGSALAVPVSGGRPPYQAQLLYTTEKFQGAKRTWQSVAATVDAAGVARATVPEDAREFFLNVTDAAGSASCVETLFAQEETP